MKKRKIDGFIGKDVSIECAKAYTSTGEDSASLDALQKKIDELNQENKTHSLVLLVDDVSCPDQTYDFDVYAQWLKNAGYEGAVIYKESQIKQACEELLKVIDRDKLATNMIQLIHPEHEGKYSSQFFIATWDLLRLGYLSLPTFPADLQAKKVFNILPASFKSGEDESLEIIKATPYVQAVNQIEYQFIRD